MNEPQARQIVEILTELFPGSFEDRAFDRWTPLIIDEFVVDLLPLMITVEQARVAMFARRKDGKTRIDVSEAIECLRSLDRREQYHRGRHDIPGSSPAAVVVALPDEVFAAAWWAAYRQACRVVRDGEDAHPLTLCWPLAPIRNMHREDLDKPDAQAGYWCGWIADHIDGIRDNLPKLLEDRRKRMRPSTPESRAAIRAEYTEKARAKAAEAGI